jgi:hypothetical protein
MFGLFPQMGQGQKDAMLAMGLQLLGNNGRASNLGQTAMSAVSNARRTEAEQKAREQQQKNWEQQQALRQQQFEAQRADSIKKLAIEEEENQRNRDKHRMFMDEASLKERAAEEKAKMVQRLAGTGTAIFQNNRNIDPSAPNDGPTSPDKFQGQLGEDSTPAQGPVSNESGKSDRFVARGDEGNPLALRMAGMPQPVKEAMRENPYGASDLVMDPIKSALTESLKEPDTPKQPAPKYMNIVNTKTGESLSYDTNSPNGVAEIEKRLSSGWVKETPGIAQLMKGKTSVAEEHWQTQTKEAYGELAGIRQQNEAFSRIADRLMNPKLYTGPQGTAVNELIRYGQQFGMWKDIPIEQYEAANWDSRAIFGKLRESILGPDSRLSDADRETISRAILNADYTPDGMATIMSSLEGREELLQQKLDWIEDKTSDGMSYTQAWRQWDMEAREDGTEPNKILSETMGEKAMSSRQKKWLSKKGDGPSLLDLGSAAMGDNEPEDGFKSSETSSGAKFQYRLKE